MSKPHVTRRLDVTQAAEAAPLPPGNAPPNVAAPVPPPGWTRSKWVRPREGLKPTRSQVDASAQAAAELRGSTSWGDDFGNKAPAAKALADVLAAASSWREAWLAAGEWLAYCSEQRRLWEDAAFTQVAELKPLFDYVSAHDPTIVRRYPSTKLIVGARAVSSQRAATSRKNNGRRKVGAAPVVPELAVSPGVVAAH